MSLAEIRKDGIDGKSGAPQLYVDGKKTVPLWYALSDIPAAGAWNPCSQRGIKNFSDCGIDIVCVDTELHKGWQENGEYDPEALYSDIAAVIYANPNAKVITRLHLNPPYWWLRKYPEEHIKFHGKRELGGKTEYVELENTDCGYYGDRTIARKLPTEIRASMASKQWLQDCGDMLEDLCKKVKAHPLGKHLIGIQVAYGTCGEWHYWSSYGTGQNEPDFSAPMQRLFCEILKERYTLDELRAYYGADATFENVRMATLEERMKYFSGTFCEPETDMRVIDSMRCFSRASADAISYFCKRIKYAWGKGLLTGAFYGYFFWGTGAQGAHVATDRVFADENLDFLVAPCGYSTNKYAGNMNILRYAAESCRLNGKLMLCEMDQGYESWCDHTVYACENEEEYAAVMKRNVMENILLGNGAWYYDHRLPTVDAYRKVEYWNKPERLQTVKDMQHACEKIIEKPYKKTAEVLVVVDCETRYHIQLDLCKLPVIDALGKSGAGFDRVHLYDLEKCDLSQYKCVLLVNCRVMSQKTYEYIQNTVVNKDRTTVFVDDYATVVNGKTCKIRLAEWLGVACDTDYTECVINGCKVGVMPKISELQEVYRDIFKRAGAHIYTDNGEVVIADNEMVMVHCKGIPQTTLHLHCGDIEIENGKYNTVVYNTFTGEKIL